MKLKCIFKINLKKMLAALMAVVMTAISLQYVSLPKMTKAAGEFPVSGVHSGTLSHGAYKRLTNLKASTGATVIEADTMTSEGESRACFCMSPGISQTTKSGAYKSATYASGYGMKYYKSMIAFYYDCKDNYKTDAVRYAANIFIWRTVILERKHKGNFAASAYDGSGFKSGFVATMKNLMGYSDTTASNIYDKAYGYIKKGVNGDYNSKVKLLKWTATKSQTMLTGKPYADKSCRIKFKKALSEDNGVSIKGTQYTVYSDAKCTKKVKVLTMDNAGTDVMTLSANGTYSGTDTYYIKETKAVTGTVSNKDKVAMSFSVDWSAVKDGENGGLAVIGAKKVVTAKAWLKNLKNIEGQFVDDVPSISVTAYKVDGQNSKPLAGAVFQIQTWDRNQNKYVNITAASNLGHTVSGTITTGSDGKAASAKLYYTSKNQGKFKIEEIKAPAGYMCHNDSKEFNIKSGANTTQKVQSAEYTFKNDKMPVLTDIYIIKTDGDTGEPIKTAGFTLYEASVLTRNGVSTYMGHKYANAYKEFEQEKGKEGLTNKYAAKRIPEGYYTIEETKVPLGYSIGSGTGFYNSSPFGRLLSEVRGKDSPYRYIKLVYAGEKGVYECDMNAKTHVFTKSSTPVDAFTLEVTNTQAAGSLVINKKDDKTNEPLSGAKFTVWEVSRDNYNKAGYIPDAENGDVVYATAISDERGKCEFGTDYARYKLDSDGKPLIDENGEVVKRDDYDPSCCSYGLKAEHYYMIVEEAAPDGYRLPKYPVRKFYVSADEAKNTVSIEINDDPLSYDNHLSFEKEITITNEKAQLDLNIHKVSTSRTGKESVALQGAEFALYKVEKIVTDDEALSDEQTALEDKNNNGIDDNTEGIISKDTVITDDSDAGADEETGNEIDYSVLSNENYIDFDYSTITPIVKDITTDENGNATVSKILEEGAYVLVETKAPKNYLKADPQYIYIDYATLMSTVEYNIEVQDEEFDARLTIEKQDARTGKIIRWAGTGYKIKNKTTGEYIRQTLDTYAEPEVEGAPHELIKSEEVDVFYTDETGTVQLPEVLAVGTYELEEVVAPEGYLLANETLEFVIDDEMDYYPEDDNRQYDIDENSRDVVITVEQENEPTQTEFHKTDFVTGEEIDGAELEVWYLDENNNKVLVDSWTSKSDEAHIIYALEIGREYHMSETHPADGYATAEDVVFTVADTADVQKVEMKDYPTTVQITKSDITTGEPVIGATLQVIDKDGKIIEEWITESEPHLINKLPIGNYVLREIQAPTDNGYVKQLDIEFSVLDTKEIQKVDMSDDYTKVKISKTDITGEKEIEGAVLSIKDSDGKVTATWTTDGKPYEIYRLAPGEYTLIEENAPYGYIKAEDIKFTVKETGEVQEVVMKDKEASGMIKLVKKDRIGGDTLEGAVFTVTDAGGKIVGTMTTNGKGYAEYKNLFISTDKNSPETVYYVYESKAPDGYITDKTKHKVTLKYADQKTPIIERDLGSIYNEKIPETTTPKTPEPDKPKVPKTGIKSDRFIFSTAGIVLFAVTVVNAVVIYSRRRKQNGESE